MADEAVPTQTTRALPWGLILPWSLFAAAIIAWSIYWFVLAGAAAKSLEEARTSAPGGGRLQYEKVETAGFPFRLMLVMSRPSFSGPNEAYLASAPQATLVVNPLNPGHVLLFAQSPITASAGGKTWTITADLAEASLHNAQVRVALAAPKIQNESGGLAAKAITVAIQPDPKNNEDRMIAVTANDAVLNNLKGFEGFASASAQVKAGLVLENVGALARTEAPIAEWARTGAHLRVEAMEVTAGQLHVTGDGQFTLDAAARPQGALGLDFADVAAGARAIAGSQTLSPGARLAAEAFASAQGLAGGAVELALVAEDGRWRLGPIDLGPADPLF